MFLGLHIDLASLRLQLESIIRDERLDTIQEGDWLLGSRDTVGLKF